VFNWFKSIFRRGVPTAATVAPLPPIVPFNPAAVDAAIAAMPPEPGIFIPDVSAPVASSFSEWARRERYDEAALSPKQRVHLEAAWRAETGARPVASPLHPEAPAMRHTAVSANSADERERRAGIDRAYAQAVRVTGYRILSDDGRTPADHDAVIRGLSVQEFQQDILALLRREGYTR
jgi:hypothetical protein